MDGSSAEGLGETWMRSLRIMRKTRLCRKERSSSFLVSRREMPSAGGARFVEDGSEEAAEVRDSMRVVRRAGRIDNVSDAAMLDHLKSR